ncbi:hypothetical protein ES288_A11G305300v1 [Gossypium darwinii]|uniref:Major facilitator superfamily (MFS) profile domain-containing protein n=1 Tax=Gossypium darwinii TaxID=34276 RepID=A0A5D2ER05_GOSDA|nr:hypothetical protein ES288_A11G305300v1 [Gossypium darwinii]
MEKNEMLEGLVTRRPITDEAETSIIDGDSVISYNNHASTSVTITVIFSTIVAISGSYAFGNAVGYSSPAKSGIMKDLGLSLSEYAVFGSILTVGGMLGAACSGKIADLVGRRGAMGISEIFCITGWFAIVFSKDALWLDLGRLLVGCGSGVLCYVIPLYLAEIAAKNVRGAFSSLTILMLCCGKAVMFIMGSLINWRTSALIGVIPCVLQLIRLFFIPESPRWLAKTNETKEFEAALRRLRGEHADISQEATDIRLYTEYIEQIPDEGLLNLFQKRYAYPLIVGAGLMMFQQFGGLNGFSYYASFIFESAGFPSTVGSIGVAVLQIFMAIIGVLFIDKSGRRPLLLMSAGGSCLGCVITGLSFFLQDFHARKDLTATLVIIGVLVFLLSFELGMGGIPWIIVSEIFPLNIRGSGGSMVNLINWTSSWVVSYTFTFLFEWNSAGTFFILAFMGAVGTVFIGKLVPETKGRTLEELQTY